MKTRWGWDFETTDKHGWTRMKTSCDRREHGRRCEGSGGPHRGLWLPRLRSERRRGLGRGGVPQWLAAGNGEAPLAPFVPHGARETEALVVTGGHEPERRALLGTMAVGRPQAEQCSALRLPGWAGSIRVHPWFN